MNLGIAAAILLVGLFAGLAGGGRVFLMLLSVAVAAYGFGAGMDGLRFLADLPWVKAANFNFLAIPVYVLLGSLLQEAGVIPRMMYMVTAWAGRVPGSLGLASLITAGGFSAISGSASATAATLGRAFTPEARKYGYDLRFLAGILNGGAGLDPLIPPSIALIIYSQLTDTPIPQLYAAALLPGILMLGLQMIYVTGVATVRPQLAPTIPLPPMRERLASLVILPVLIALVVLVLGGVFLGWYTPSEGGALGVLGAILIIFVRYRGRPRQSVASVWRASREASGLASIIVPLVVAAFIYSHVLAFFGLPQIVAEFFVQAQLSPALFIFLYTVVLLVLGMFVDPATMQVITVPLVAATAFELGFDPLWLGVYVTWFMEIASLTPPFGVHLFILQSAMGLRYEEVLQGSLPLVVIWVIGAAALLTFPALATWLPSLMGP